VTELSAILGEKRRADGETRLAVLDRRADPGRSALGVTPKPDDEYVTWAN
jgi:hypothetical protein